MMISNVNNPFIVKSIFLNLSSWTSGKARVKGPRPQVTTIRLKR